MSKPELEKLVNKDMSSFLKKKSRNN